MIDLIPNGSRNVYVRASSSEVRGMDKREPENQREKRFPIFRSTERNLPAD